MPHHHHHRHGMEHLLGLLKIKVLKGVNLAIRDVSLRTSDPYVIVKMGSQKLKTRVVKKSTNPEWNEELTLSIDDPNLPIKVLVYDKDTFTLDDKMGDAEFHIGSFLEAQRTLLDRVPSGTVISKVQPSRDNCYAKESPIIWKDGKVVQNMVLRLRNVERGEVELEIHWVDIPGSRGLAL
ncbi:GTPase activating protein 1-like [Punica granatum]|uniref:GTPase activating protein 1-like n=2 Tax=Punica granatum TaxID=22663 RepID=A0A6P8CZW7_PUNGR|nr:GTPase activating protein 1-like [Punica granatum]